MFWVTGGLNAYRLTAGHKIKDIACLDGRAYGISTAGTHLYEWRPLLEDARKSAFNYSTRLRRIYSESAQFLGFCDISPAGELSAAYYQEIGAFPGLAAGTRRTALFDAQTTKENEAGNRTSDFAAKLEEAYKVCCNGPKGRSGSRVAIRLMEATMRERETEGPVHRFSTFEAGERGPMKLAAEKSATLEAKRQTIRDLYSKTARLSKDMSRAGLSAETAKGRPGTIYSTARDVVSVANTIGEQELKRELAQKLLDAAGKLKAMRKQRNFKPGDIVTARTLVDVGTQNDAESADAYAAVDQEPQLQEYEEPIATQEAEKEVTPESSLREDGNRILTQMCEILEDRLVRSFRRIVRFSEKKELHRMVLREVKRSRKPEAATRLCGLLRVCFMKIGWKRVKEYSGRMSTAEKLCRMLDVFRLYFFSSCITRIDSQSAEHSSGFANWHRRRSVSPSA